MCGRYALYQTGELSERFDLNEAAATEIEDDLHERYNIAPSQIVPTIYKKNDDRHIELMHWGYLPNWAKDERAVFKYKTFNARSEGIFQKPTWKNAVRYRRCLVPANGFYEWKATATGKQPYFIHPKDQELFAFAGIYGEHTDESGNTFNTYSIITTRPSADMLSIHDRMPVILHPAEEELWLDPTNDSEHDLQGIMRPYDNGKLEVYPVSREVNASRADTADMIGPVNSK